MWNPAPSETLEQQIDFFSWLYEEHQGFLSQDDRKYFWGKGLSKSGLDGLRKSMDHYFKSAFKETDEMLLGLAFHCRILEPSKYDDRFLFYEKKDGRTAEGKEQAKEIETKKEKLKQEGIYQKIIKTADHETILGMEEALFEHPEAGPLFKNGGISEETVVWNNEKHGTLMKGKLDFRIPHEKVIIDLKTTGSAHIDDVTHTFRRGRLAVQHAMYVDGVTAVTGEDGWRFLFVFVETKKPYGIQIFELSEKTEQRARETYTNDIQVVIDWIENAKIALKEKRQMYTGYTTNIKVLDL